jgi:short-subunit dehydrogenase
MAMSYAPLAVVTGASTGIGLELARLCSEEGMRLVIVANEPEIDDAKTELEGAQVRAVNADLSTPEGVDELLATVMRTEGEIDYLFANAGKGLGGAFIDQSIDDIMEVIQTNVTGTVYLLHHVVRSMVARDSGRVLITGSIAGFLPGSFQAVYNGTKAFLDNFALGLRNELKDTNVTVSCLMPGPTDTEFFERADMMDTKVGQDESKGDPAKVARIGFDAMMKGEASVVAGMGNKMQVAMAKILPKTASAEQHRKLAEPGTGKEH